MMMNGINLLAVGLSLALGFFLGVAYEHWRIGRKLDAVERRVNQIEAAIRSSDPS
jgi:hypothetical protein